MYNALCASTLLNFCEVSRMREQPVSVHARLPKAFPCLRHNNIATEYAVRLLEEQLVLSIANLQVIEVVVKFSSWIRARSKISKDTVFRRALYCRFGRDDHLFSQVKEAVC